MVPCHHLCAYSTFDLKCFKVILVNQCRFEFCTKWDLQSPIPPKGIVNIMHYSRLFGHCDKLIDGSVWTIHEQMNGSCFPV